MGLRVAAPVVFAIYILTWQEFYTGDLACGGTEGVLRVWCIWEVQRPVFVNSDNTSIRIAWQPWNHMKVRDLLRGIGVMSWTTGQEIQRSP